LIFIALTDGIKKNFPQCVEQLIKIGAPSEVNEALQLAAKLGRTQCVELLIPVSDPCVGNSNALQEAVWRNHTTCIDLLYPVSDPPAALRQLQRDYPHQHNKWGKLQEMVDAEQAERLQNTLNAEVETTTAVKVQRKM